MKAEAIANKHDGVIQSPRYAQGSDTGLMSQQVMFPVLKSGYVLSVP